MRMRVRSTCAQKEQVIGGASRCRHGYCCEVCVAHIAFEQQGPAARGYHRPSHQGVQLHEVQDQRWQVLG